MKSYYVNEMKPLNKRKIFELFISSAGLAVCSLGLVMNVSGVFFGPIAEVMNVGKGAVSLTSTLVSLSTGFASIASIRVIKKAGFEKVVVISVIATALATVCCGYADSIWQLYALSIVRGVSSAFIGTSVITMIIGNWFISMRGLISGLVMSFSGLSGAVMSPILSKAVSSFGYQKSFLIISIMMILVSLPAMLFLSDNPDNEGYVPYGTEKTDIKESYVISFSKSSIEFIFLIFISFICQSICSLSQHLAVYGETIGYSLEQSAVFISCAMIGNISGKFLVGFLNDKTGAIKSGIILVGTFMIGALMLRFLYFNYLTMMIGSLLLGTSYASAVMLSNLTFELYGINQYGTAYSIITAVNSTGGAIGVAVIGYCYDYLQSYAPVISGIIFLCFLVMLCIVYIYKKVRNYDLSDKKQIS